MIINKEVVILKKEEQKAIPKIEKKFINIEEVSTLIGLGLGTINKYVKNGVIPSYKVGKRRLYDKDEVILWMKTHKEGK